VFVPAGVLVLALYAVYTPVPEIGNILMPYRLGPRTLRDTFLLGQNFPSIPASMKIFWISGIIVSAFGAVGLLLYFVQTAVHVSRGLWRPNWRAVTWVEALTLVFIGAYACLLLMFMFSVKLLLFDRYLLVVAPCSSRE